MAEHVDRVDPTLQRQDTNYRNGFTPGLKIADILRYMATGHSCKCMQYEYRVSNEQSILTTAFAMPKE